ncbi:MAG: hypothetical protein ACHQIK_22595 [Candidatus Acidiferrales bacterium]
MDHPHNRAHGQQRTTGSRRERFGWPFKAVVISAALLIGFFDHMLQGWGRAGLVAAAALIVPIYGCREFWNRGQFWITVALLAVIQVPLAIAVRPWVEQGGLSSMLTLGIADCLFVIVVIFLVCSESSGESS